MFRLSGTSALIVLLTMVLASCGSNKSVSPPKSSLTKVPLSKVLRSYTPKINVGSPVNVNWGNTPILNLSGAVDITKFGSIYRAEFNGSTSQIFVRPTPKSNFAALGTIDGEIIQLQFPSQKYGFALVRNPSSNPSGIATLTTLYSSSDGGKKWAMVATGLLTQIHFFSPQDGVGVTSVTISTADQPPSDAIETTTDGGKNWRMTQILAIASSNGVLINSASFSFPSQAVGFLAISSQPGAGSQAKTLLTTHNGGTTWKVVSTAGSSNTTSGLPITGYLEEVTFSSPTNGYLVVARGPRGAVYSSTDGGISWSTDQILPASLSPSTSIAYYRHTTPYGPLAITNFGAVWSSNSANTWKQVFPSYWPSQLSFADQILSGLTLDGRGVVIPLDSSKAVSFTSIPASNPIYFKDFSSGEVAISGGNYWLKTRSGPWKDIPIPNAGQVLFSDFLSPNNGILVTTAKRDKIVATSDGGSTWRGVQAPFMPISLDMLSTNNWWVIGGVQGPLLNNPYKKNVTVTTYSLYHTTDGGKTWKRFTSSYWSNLGPYGVKFQSASIGYFWTSQQLLVTLDGGKSFKARPLPSWMQISSDHGLVPTGNSSAVVTDGSLPLFRTNDNGASFSAIS